jgi:hypothetical protein
MMRPPESTGALRPVLAFVLPFVLVTCLVSARADSVVVFNEIQYHPSDPTEV